MTMKEKFDAMNQALFVSQLLCEPDRFDEKENRPMIGWKRFQLDPSGGVKVNAGDVLLVDNQKLERTSA